ncbi:hypothetical protein SMD44_05454 [Streptomyces alboflavus]|uniref:Uncharacterized protein n=1 Tax=Streptomyces alboflavus TaxID=67267 RepID=A0A1Z1WHR0_9ACTN|nr:hypothetical protein SMD44_05454 [Streptomyces alboflavus]
MPSSDPQAREDDAWPDSALRAAGPSDTGQPNLVDLIALADETALAASGLGCLDRCLPLLGDDDQVLRPLWVSIADGTAWEGALGEVRGALGVGGAAGAGETAGSGGSSRSRGPGADSDATALARRMLDAVPTARSADSLRTWADGCSAAALQIHRLLDAGSDGVSPLVAAELRRQVRVLELLGGRAGTGGGLRQVLDVSTEGRRVLRAVVSRSRRSVAGAD